MRQATTLASSILLNSNQVTLAAYEQHALEYILKTPVVPLRVGGELANWVIMSLEHIPANSSVLEIGSATPRDALFIRDQGFKVQCTDATEAFLEELRNRGENAYYLDILESPLQQGRYEMIFANAVLQHFTPEEAYSSMAKIFDALPSSGIFAFTTKQGFGEKWITEKFSSKRFVHYWNPQALLGLLELVGFETIHIRSNVRGEFNNHSWIMITARKP